MAREHQSEAEEQGGVLRELLGGAGCLELVILALALLVLLAVLG